MDFKSYGFLSDHHQKRSKIKKKKSQSSCCPWEKDVVNPFRTYFWAREGEGDWKQCGWTNHA